MPSVSRIIKTELKDADDKGVNPVSAFTRFGCWPLGPRSYIAGIRAIFALSIGITIFVDWGLIDSLAHYKRQSNDGDSVWFWFRPQDWIHAGTFIMLILMFIASGFKRIDSEMDTNYPRTFLIIWNLLLALIPLSTASLIFYYHVLRWGASSDDAYEATILQVFIINTLELMWGGWPSEWMDVAFPTLLSIIFILYTLLLNKMFHIELYTQLDWENKPQLASTNATIFVLVVFICSIISTFIAISRNQVYSRLSNNVVYLPVSRV
jgi:hypothetical protein